MDERLHGHDWFEIREQVLERDNWSCRNCGEGSNLVVHHIVPINSQGTNQVTNLVTLCRQCHRSAHNHRWKEESGSSPESASRKIFSTEVISTVCRSTRHPLHLALIGIVAKTGIGVGEICNLDLTDVALKSDTTDALPELSGSGLQIRYGGAIPYSNRRERKERTVIPADSELEDILLRWIAIRPDTPHTDALFVKTKEKWGERIDPSTVRYVFEKIGRDHGLYSEDNEMENLTPVSLRYFFEERFNGRPAHREYILGREAGADIDYPSFEDDYRQNVFKISDPSST